MKRLLLALSLLLSSNLVSAQVQIQPGQLETPFSAQAAGTATSSSYSMPATYGYLTWQTVFSVAPASVTVLLEGSNDNVTFATIDTSTNVSGEIRNASTSAKFIRFRVSAESGGGTLTLITILKDGTVFSSGIFNLPTIIFGDGSCAFPSVAFGTGTIGFYKNSSTSIGYCGVLTGSNGTVSAPSYSFTSETNTGIYRVGSANLGISIAGNQVLNISQNSGLTISTALPLEWGSSGTSTPDVFLKRAAANRLYQVNGINTQELRIANTDDGAGNSEFFGIDWQTNVNRVVIGSGITGTGTARTVDIAGQSIRFLCGGAISTAGLCWQISSGGTISANGAFNITTTGTAQAANVNVTSGYQVAAVASIYNVASDFTTANNTSLQTITGLSWTLPATTALVVPFRCVIFYSQATAAVSDSFGLQTDTVTPTNFQAGGSMETALGTTAYGDAAIANTTATVVVTGTPGSTGTIFNAYVDGLLENPSNASTTTVNVMVKTTVGADAITIKRGSFCRVF